jgi:hypothetical protein
MKSGPDVIPCLFAEGRANPMHLPDDWTGAKLDRLVQALGWAGLAGDMNALVAAQSGQSADHVNALARSTAEINAADAARVVARLRPIALFGADAGVAEATAILDHAFAAHPQAPQLRAWLGCLWLARLGRHPEAVAAFRSVPDVAPPDDLTVAAYLDALRQTGARPEA